MIECIFTLDYEIYGNGTGTLKELVHDPAERLRETFENWKARFVVFAEVAELLRIDACGTDPGIDDVKRQLRDFHRDGFEIGLHLHPQWFNAQREQATWILDYNEYNLCALSRERILQIVEHSLNYLRDVVGRSEFTPLSFRAGNWLFQPTETAASVLREKGIKIDSSVFKGGLQHDYALDYRPALKNDFYWSFGSDVNQSDANGPWLELPIYTEMVPFWKMATSKRMGFVGAGGRSHRQKLNRILDLMRFWYPLKLDFCRMTLKELTSMLDRIVREDQAHPSVYRPIVAIGHTKDLVDLQTVDALLSFLRTSGIAISTFEDAYPELLRRALERGGSNEPGSRLVNPSESPCEPATQTSNRAHQNWAESGNE